MQQLPLVCDFRPYSTSWPNIGFNDITIGPLLSFVACWNISFMLVNVAIAMRFVA
jgi:hypothetical protein